MAWPKEEWRFPQTLFLKHQAQNCTTKMKENTSEKLMEFEKGENWVGKQHEKERNKK